MAAPTTQARQMRQPEVQQDPNDVFKAVMGPMAARRAYRRYNGTWRQAVRMETSGPLLLIAVMWGLYGLEVGTIEPCGSDVLDPDVNSGRDAGLSIRFVWAYTSDTSRVAAIIAGFIYLAMSYLIMRYQHKLGIRWCSWVTAVVVVVLLGLAVEAVVHDVEEGKNLQQRQELVWAWIVVQAVLLAIAYFRMKLLPRLNERGHLVVLKLQEHTLERGAREDLPEIWERFPPLKQYLESEYGSGSEARLVSFKGKYVDGVTSCCTGKREHTAVYVGGLDAAGAPHGAGVWSDSYEHGEFFVGRFDHGTPIAPMRARTNTGSSSVAYRIAVLSCRTDATGSTGSFGGGTPATPLRAGVASVECCTCGLFYKGFPRVTWLQEPTAIIKAAKGGGDGGLEAISVAMNAAGGPSNAGGKCRDASAEGRDGDKAARPLQSLPTMSRNALWGNEADTSRIDVTQLSPWIFNPSNAVIGGGHVASAQGGYDALLFIHGFNSDLDQDVSLVSQLFSLGSFPPTIMPAVFGWPCTTSIAYPLGHKVVKSDFVIRNFDAALEYLKADGCRRVHVVAHSMGARVLAGVSQRIADIFAPSPLATEPRRSAVPPRYSREEFDLGSVIMLSPDMDLGEFAGHTGPLLRSVCDNVVIYGDEHDSALNIASICNRYLFKWWPGLAMPNLAEHCAKLGVPLGATLGRHCRPVPKVGGGVLDVDVVVTSHLQSNLHGMRHNYFHLNHEMVCDLRDVIVHGNRARDRVSRLEPAAHNTYSFLVAPPYVVAA